MANVSNVRFMSGADGLAVRAGSLRPTQGVGLTSDMKASIMNGKKMKASS